MGWAQSNIAPTPQQLRLRPSGGYASVEGWHGGDGDKETVLVHRLGTAGGGGGGELVSSATEPKFEQCSFRSVLRLVYSLISRMYFVIVSYSASFIFSIRLHIRPSSYFIELVIVGQ